MTVEHTYIEYSDKYGLCIVYQCPYNRWYLQYKDDVLETHLIEIEPEEAERILT